MPKAKSRKKSRANRKGPAAKGGLGKPADFRRLILARLDALNWSKYELIKKRLAGKVTSQRCYNYLRGDSDIGSHALAIMLHELGMDTDGSIRREPAPRQPGKRGRPAKSSKAG